MNEPITPYSDAGAATVLAAGKFLNAVALAPAVRRIQQGCDPDVMLFGALATLGCYFIRATQRSPEWAMAYAELVEDGDPVPGEALDELFRAIPVGMVHPRPEA